MIPPGICSINSTGNLFLSSLARTVEPIVIPRTLPKDLMNTRKARA